MTKNEIISELIKCKGYICSKLEFKIEEQLILFLKKNINDTVSSAKILFNGILSFHDTGFIGQHISFFDINALGFQNIYFARSRNLDPESYYQIIFITELKTGKVELMIACQKIDIIFSS